MKAQLSKLLSLGALVTAGMVGGVLVAGGVGVTPHAGAAPAPERVVDAASVGAAGLPDFATLAERVVPSVVSVYSTDVVQPSERGRKMPGNPFEFFFGPQMNPHMMPQQDEPMVRQGAGSGFFISEDGELLTNNHVVDGADKIEIQLDDKSIYQVTVVGRDEATDIALLRVSEPNRKFPALGLGDSEGLRVGEWVMAVGNPLNMDHTVTVGVVSAKGRVLGISDSSFENFIQTDAAINFGNSGGPLLNTRGEVVGINTAINAGGQNLSFAVPASTAERILTQLRSGGKVVRGYLGAQVRNVDQKIQESFGLPDRKGAFVEEVLPKHAAAKAGLKPGDVVVSIKGRPIEDTRELIDTVSAYPPGSELRLEVVRDGKRVPITVTLDERPSGDEEVAPDQGGGEESESARVGISVSDLSPQVRQMYRIEKELEGVVVTHVDPVSAAGEEGLQRGDVITQANGRVVTSPEELDEQVRAVTKGGYLRLYVYRARADQSFFAILKLDK
jgi:serine protease Do